MDKRVINSSKVYMELGTLSGLCAESLTCTYKVGKRIKTTSPFLILICQTLYFNYISLYSKNPYIIHHCYVRV